MIFECDSYDIRLFSRTVFDEGDQVVRQPINERRAKRLAIHRTCETYERTYNTAVT